jgi:transcriptional regulator with XRE-family HTH domain
VADGPTVRRRRLGAELRALRENCGFKLEEVADKLGIASSTLSRIETGKAPTKTAYLSAMLREYQVTDSAAVQLLLDMAREGHRKGWWSVYDDVLPSGMGMYVGLEGEATGLRSYEAMVVHGLLQTPEYARAVLKEMYPRFTEEQLRRMADVRIERQRRLDSDHDGPPFDLWVIHDESVIRRVVGGRPVMRMQLSHLLRLTELPGVTLQVLPFDSGAHAAHSGCFSVLEFPERTDMDVVYVESVAGVAFLEKEKDVRQCTEAFERLRAAALSPGASVDLVARLTRELSS